MGEASVEAADHIASGSQAGAWIAAVDGSRTPLGPPAGWPAALRSALRMVLGADAPLLIYWGDDATLFFNDAAAGLLGAGARLAGADAMGRRGADVWGTAWPPIERELADVMAGRAGAWPQDRPTPLRRHGESPGRHWTCACLPIASEAAATGVGGVLVVARESSIEGVAGEPPAGTDAAAAEAPAGADAAPAEAPGPAPPGRPVAPHPAAISRTWAVSPDLLGILDAEGRFQASNPAWQATLGWSEDELRRTPFLEFVHPDDVARTLAAWDALGQGVPALRFENRYRTRAGGWRWLSWVSVPEGDVFHCSARDIDAEKQQALELARVAGEHERLWQSSRDILFALELDGTVVSVNPAASAILGWRREELVGSKVFDWIVADDLPVSQDALADARQAAMGVVENRYRHRDGGFRWISWVAAPEGNRVFATGRHVTAEKEAALALARTLAERDRIWLHSRDVIVVIDLKGDIVSCNPAAAEVLGWSAAEMIGRPVLGFIHPDDRPPLEADGSLIRERYARPRIAVNRFRCKDGSERRISWLSAGSDDGLVYSSGRDITAETERAEALRAAEERLRQSQKMEAVGQLTGGIAHDFNNLLMGIGGSLQMMQKRLVQGRVGELDRYAVAAQGDVRRAAALTHRLLAFSRRQTLDPKPTDVNRLLAGMADLIRRSVGPAIALEVVGADALWTTLVDANQLENAVLNLCLNARDAMAGGGRIRVETANCRLDDDAARERDVAPGAYVSVCVRDTGIGMTPEVVSRAFEPFFTTKPPGAGTGLGLSMIYGFARQSGGHVRIESAPGRGTTMRLDLPRHLGAAATVPAGPARLDFPAAAPGETVLVVDDEPTVRMLVAEALDDAGFAVLEAGDGAAALRVLESAARVDLLVTDIGLPGAIDGRQVARAARARRPGLKVLFITGYAEHAVPGDSFEPGGFAILTKPFAIEALGAKVGGLLGA